MSTLPDAEADGLELPDARSSAVPLSTRVSTVFLGRMDFFSVLLRLIGMELYKLRRRLMANVLGPLALLLAALASLARLPERLVASARSKTRTTRSVFQEP